MVRQGTLQTGQADISIQANLLPDAVVRITAEYVDASGNSTGSLSLGDHPYIAPAVPTSPPRARWLSRFQNLTLEQVLFGTGLFVYLLTRLFRIADFPIYFFTDEAVQTVLAADLVRDGFYSYDDELLPTFFYNGYQYNLGISVYLQVLPYLLFGKTVWLTRAVAATITLLAAAAVGLSLSKVFRLPYAWTGVLLLSITPAWFLHSRTAFETGLAVTFFALFLYFYLRYRTGSPGYLYLAAASGALAFYSYNPARAVMGVSALLLLFSDMRYHFTQRRTVLRAFALTLLFAVPLLRFTLQHPTAVQDHLNVLNSYWVEQIPLVEKVLHFLKEYARGLNPMYWYFPNAVDLERHLMKGYGHVLWWTLPFLLIGLVITLRRIKQPESRVLLIAILAAPAGAALVAVGITRTLCMVIPLALISGIGLSWTITQAVRLFPGMKTWLPGLVFGSLCLSNVLMTADALTNGPLWYQDYGLAGMQWGAKQLFAELDRYTAEHPQENLIVSPSWGNGTDVTARFFFPSTPPFQMGSIEGYFNEKQPLDDNTLFVMLPSEYEAMQESGKFTCVNIEKSIPYPNGEPGFLFVRLAYIDQIDEVLTAERASRRILREDDVSVGSEVWRVKYSTLDLGKIEDAFDGDPESLLRTMEANPLVVQIDFPAPKTIHTVQVKIGGPPAVVDLYFTDETGAVIPYTRTVVETSAPKTVEFQLDSEIRAVRLRVEVNSVRDQEPAHVHLWEIGIE